jgi:non-ribosomal peptide synthetase-like protein
VKPGGGSPENKPVDQLIGVLACLYVGVKRYCPDELFALQLSIRNGSEDNSTFHIDPSIALLAGELSASETLHSLYEKLSMAVHRGLLQDVPKNVQIVQLEWLQFKDDSCAICAVGQLAESGESRQGAARDPNLTIKFDSGDPGSNNSQQVTCGKAEDWHPGTVKFLESTIQVLMARREEAWDRPVYDLELHTGNSIKELLEASTIAGMDTSVLVPLPMLLQRQSNSSAIALKMGKRVIPYKEYHRLICVVASKLQLKGFQKGATAAVLAARSPELLIVMMGAWKAGLTVVPLDCNAHPSSWVNIVQDAEAAVVVLEEDQETSFLQSRTINMQDLLAESHEETEAQESISSGIHLDDLAMLLYTSGSTGKPKGVLLSHRYIAGYIASCASYIQKNAARMICYYKSTWMAFLFQAFTSLQSAGTVSLFADTQFIDPFEMCRIIRDERLTFVDFTPAFLAQVLSAHQSITNNDGSPLLPQSVKMVELGGEPVTKDIVCKLVEIGRASNIDVINGYGSTEAGPATMLKLTIDENGHFTWPSHSSNVMPIGCPFAYQRAFVFERFPESTSDLAQPFQLVAPGVPGDLYISGPLTCEGYLKRPELNVMLLNPCSYHDGWPMCRTGDMAKWEGGHLIHMGRADGMVKLRGFRIDTSELRTFLLAIPGVKEAHVSAREIGGQKAVVMHLSPNTVNVAQIWENLSELPTLAPVLTSLAVVPILEFKLNANNKLDSKSLPPAESYHFFKPKLSDAAFPSTATEEDLAKMICELTPGTMAPATFNIDAHLFSQVGLASAAAVSLVNKLRSRYEVGATLADIIGLATVRKIAARLSGAEGGASDPPVPVEVEDDKAAIMAGTTLPGWPRRIIFTIFVLASTAVLYCLIGFAELFPVFVLPEIVNSGNILLVAAFYAVLQFGIDFVLAFMLLILKWAVLGRVHPGLYQLYGVYHFRLALYKRFVAMMELVSTFEQQVAGTGAASMYLRLLGANVGQHVFFGGTSQKFGCFMTNLEFPFLMSVGDYSCINCDAKPIFSQITRSGHLLVGNIDIGQNTVIHSGAVLMPNSKIGSNCTVDYLSVTMSRTPLLDQHISSGSPPQLSIEKNVIEAEPMWTYALSAKQLVLTLAFVLVNITAALPVSFLLMAVYPNITGTESIAEAAESWALYGVPGQIISLLFGVVLFISLKNCLLGSFEEAETAVNSGEYLQYWAYTQNLLPLIQAIQPELIGTAWAKLLYQAAGAKIGSFVELAAALPVPELTTLDEKSIVTYGPTVSNFQVGRGRMQLGAIQMGKQSVAGNYAILPPKTCMAEGAILGFLSIADDPAMVGDTVHFGIPAQTMPSPYRDKGQMAPDPVWWEQARRYSVECFMLVFLSIPLTFVQPAISLAISSVLFYTLHYKWYEVCFAYALLMVGMPIVTSAFGVIMKFLVIGIRQPVKVSVWSWYSIRSTIAVNMQTLVDTAATELLSDTPFMWLSIWLMGGKVSPNVLITNFQPFEADLLDIGPGCILNQCTLPTHTFEGGMWKTGKIKLAKNVYTHPGAFVCSGASVACNVTLGPQTMVWQKEDIPPNSVWYGHPARQYASLKELAMQNVAEDVQTTESSPLLKKDSLRSQQRQCCDVFV